MKAGDVSGGRPSLREAWLSTPLSDPNAALWASITPPANRDIPTLVRRRAAAFSLDLLAQRLHLRFPASFSSRSAARAGILGAAMAFGASVGLIGFLALASGQRSSSDADPALTEAAVEALQPTDPGALSPAARRPLERDGLARQGATVADITADSAHPSVPPPNAAASAPTATPPATTLPPTFAATALPLAAERAVVTPAQRRALIQERRAAARAKAKSKRAASAKHKASARRAAKSRRTRALTE